MKEENGYQGVGATEFDYPNSMNPKPHAPIYYGNQHVPHPTNSAAKIVQPEKIMKQVLDAK
jgi:hypothetical protein